MSPVGQKKGNCFNISMHLFFPMLTCSKYQMNSTIYLEAVYFRGLLHAPIKLRICNFIYNLFCLKS